MECAFAISRIQFTLILTAVQDLLDFPKSQFENSMPGVQNQESETISANQFQLESAKAKIRFDHIQYLQQIFYHLNQGS